ncbi:MAG TPA: CBS domain-containing protein [Syntrophorhabdales bacterium]|nr:CBS domain-containing protein [Syntrophorhabdales bacterium]
MKTVKEILKTKSKDIWSVGPKATVYDALKMMADKQIGALVVLDDKGKVAGIITERDYARKVMLKGKSQETPVAEIMTPAAEMYVLKPENTVEECMVLMTGKHVRHLPVFEQGSFIGLVSIGDVVKSIISEQETLIEHLSNYIAGKYVG